jgi:hypothetical protein
LTYAQAVELTWPQLMNALGIESNVTANPEADLIVARQDEIFERIIRRRFCLPIDLLRIPAADLMALAAAESSEKLPTLELLLSALQRYTSNCR